MTVADCLLSALAAEGSIRLLCLIKNIHGLLFDDYIFGNCVLFSRAEFIRVGFWTYGSEHMNEA